MAAYDMACRACQATWEAITTTHQGALDSKRCPSCGSRRIARLPSAIAKPTNALDPRNLTADEAGLLLDHKRDLEQGVASGRLELGVERGPKEFRPKTPRRLY